MSLTALVWRRYRYSQYVPEHACQIMKNILIIKTNPDTGDDKRTELWDRADIPSVLI